MATGTHYFNQATGFTINGGDFSTYGGARPSVSSPREAAPVPDQQLLSPLQIPTANGYCTGAGSRPPSRTPSRESRPSPLPPIPGSRAGTVDSYLQEDHHQAVHPPPHRADTQPVNGYYGASPQYHHPPSPWNGQQRPHQPPPHEHYRHVPNGHSPQLSPWGDATTRPYQSRSRSPTVPIPQAPGATRQYSMAPQGAMQSPPPIPDGGRRYANQDPWLDQGHSTQMTQPWQGSPPEMSYVPQAEVVSPAPMVASPTGALLFEADIPPRADTSSIGVDPYPGGFDQSPQGNGTQVRRGATPSGNHFGPQRASTMFQIPSNDYRNFPSGAYEARHQPTGPPYTRRPDYTGPVSEEPASYEPTTANTRRPPTLKSNNPFIPLLNHRPTN